mmetsp:Transcript_30235/g.84495  ORF Transcript_30235/g.84495 Transcript_30235/m.84495 type:complete len:275 (+) Transcript_30235:1703-2527(+)
MTQRLLGAREGDGDTGCTSGTSWSRGELPDGPGWAFCCSISCNFSCRVSTLSFRSSSDTVSIRCIFPSRSQMMRSAKNLMPTSCVTMMIVIPSSRFSWSKCCMTRAEFTESRSPVGSSNSRSSGLFAMDRAIATRCCSPPDSWLGTCSRRCDSPTRPKSSADRARRSAALSSPASTMGSSTFSWAVSAGNRLKVWNTNPRCRSRRSASVRSEVWLATWMPHISSDPFVGLSMVPKMFNKLVLPPPDVPYMQINSPRCIFTETPLSAAIPSIPKR